MSSITPQILLRAYAAGIFPMAESAEDNALYWVAGSQQTNPSWGFAVETQPSAFAGASKADPFHVRAVRSGIAVF